MQVPTVLGAVWVGDLGGRGGEGGRKAVWVGDWRAGVAGNEQEYEGRGATSQM